MRSGLIIGTSLTVAALLFPEPAYSGKNPFAKLLSVSSYYKETDREVVRQRITEYEKRVPNEAEMTQGNGRDTEFLETLEEASYISNELQLSQTIQNGLTGSQKHELFEEEEETTLRERVWTAKKKYVLDGARMAAAANQYAQAFWNVQQLLENDFKYDSVDARLIHAIREMSEGRNKQKQAELKQVKTYAYEAIGANCVFASTPFGAEGALNDTQSYYFTGRKKVYMRCYSERELGNYSGQEGYFNVHMRINENNWWVEPAGDPAKYTAGQNYVDVAFVLPKDPIDQDDFAILSVKLQFGQISSYVWDGNKQVPQWSYQHLGGSSFFWESDPSRLPQ